MSLSSEMARLALAKENWQIALEYHDETVSQDELFSDYPAKVGHIPFLLIPVEVDYNKGYIDGSGWHYEDLGTTKNPIDIYKVEEGHSYFIILGATIGNRFRVCVVNEDIRTKTSGTYCSMSLANENTPKSIYGTMSAYTNPTYNTKTPFFTSTVDGYLLIQKDANSTLGLKTYVFDLATPLGVSAADYTLDEDLFDISNGIITLKSTVDKSEISGRKAVPATVNNQTVTGLGDECFKDCTALAAIDLPDTVTSIGAYALSGTALIYFTIPSTVTSVGDYAFSGCTALREGIIPSTVQTLGTNVFEGCSLFSVARIQIPGLLTLPIGTFAGCHGMSVVTLPASVTSYGTSAFYDCRNLDDLPDMSNVTSIGESVFAYCRDFTVITVPSTLSSLPYRTFYHCENMTSLTIPSSITTIGAQAFNLCNALTEIVMEGSTPPTMPVSALIDTNNCPIYVPDNAVATYKAANGWSSYEDRIFGVSDRPVQVQGE